MLFVVKIYFVEIMIEHLYVKNEMDKSGPRPLSIFETNPFLINLFKDDMQFLTATIAWEKHYTFMRGDFKILIVTLLKSC